MKSAETYFAEQIGQDILDTINENQAKITGRDLYRVSGTPFFVVEVYVDTDRTYSLDVPSSTRAMFVNQLSVKANSYNVDNMVKQRIMDGSTAPIPLLVREEKITKYALCALSEKVCDTYEQGLDLIRNARLCNMKIDRKGDNIKLTMDMFASIKDAEQFLSLPTVIDIDRGKILNASDLSVTFIAERTPYDKNILYFITVSGKDEKTVLNLHGEYETAIEQALCANLECSPVRALRNEWNKTKNDDREQ